MGPNYVSSAVSRFVSVSGRGSIVQNATSSTLSLDGTHFSAVEASHAVEHLFLVTNIGDRDVNVTSVAISGSAAFTVSTNLPSVVLSDESSLLGITFTPSSHIQYTATVTISLSHNFTEAIVFAVTGFGYGTLVFVGSGTMRTHEVYDSPSDSIFRANSSCPPREWIFGVPYRYCTCSGNCSPDPLDERRSRHCEPDI